MMRVSEIHQKASVTLEMATTKPGERKTLEKHTYLFARIRLE
jgi:hypothetical protein